ncbi:ferredoxin--NADP reductase [Novosphingobium sp. KCTC 2891]|uniref:ferredoxin--NADP reductase n=1 Tax=Novosphingobium sp. KCTC 2891 TaxID=2989730 RepID=UPI002221516F|nr:ferredoxin--NADP reductase [Novosphingobium sp. KCTC 2891]MCW1384054.1 ferredoxin--NADP reductase [Novosphingobium sp. KCTC 2891]
MNLHVQGVEGYAPTSSLSVETVLSVRHWNDRLFSFTITRPASFRFRSGEFVMVGLAGPQRPLLRAYSIASPAWAEELEFLSIKVDDGPLTSRLQNIVPGDPVYLGRKSTGTLVPDALRPGKRLFMFGTGTGLAPFMSLIRDPDIYDQFEQIVVVHCVRHVSDLAYRAELEGQLAGDPLVQDQALTQLHYVPTVTRDAFHTAGRIGALIANGLLFDRIGGAGRLDPATDRIMLCGSMAMIRDLSQVLEGLGFEEGSNARPADFVIERAFVG